jgi:FkbM family methyltransferase
VIPLPITANVTVGGKRIPFTFFGDGVSKLVCQEVLEGLSYPIVERDFPVRSIVDVGANVGAASIYFRSHYPHAIIAAYEPFVGSFKLLQQNTAQLNVACHEKAVTGNLRPNRPNGRLYPSKIGPVGYSLFTNDSLEYMEVELVSLASVLREYQPDILKIDVEGHEWEMLGSVATSTLSKIAVIYVEYHSESYRRKIDAHLEEHVLYYARLQGPYVGELCYVKREFI